MNVTSRGAGKGAPGGRRVGKADLGGGRGKGGAGRGQGGGGGVRRRLRDGSGRSFAGAPGRRIPAAAGSGATDILTTGAPAAVAAAPLIAQLADPDLCIGCGICVDACPRSALDLGDVVSVDPVLCTGCGECVDACPRGVLSLVEA